MNIRLLKLSFSNIFLYWFVSSSLFMFPNLMSFAFFPQIRYVFYLLLVVIFLFAFSRRVKNQITSKGLDDWIKIFIFGTFIYVSGLLCAAIYFEDISGLNRALSRVIIFIILFFSICFSGEKSIKKCMIVYSNCLVIFSILGIILFFIISFLGWQPISQFDLSLSLKDRVYNNYLIGFSVKAGFFPLFNTFRVQSFYDEPGTFAMALLPGIFWFAIASRNLKKCFILIAALFLTFSVGAWLTLILSIGILVFHSSDWSNKSLVKKIKKTIYTILKTLSILVIVVYFGLTTLVDINTADSGSWIYEYTISKFYSEDSQKTSGGERLKDIPLAIDLLQENPQGVPAPLISKLTGEDISGFGVLKSVIEAGWMGLIGYSLIFVSLLGMIFWAISQMKYQQSPLIALALSVFSLMIMSFQRPDLFIYYYSAFIVSFFIKLYMIHNNTWHKSKSIKIL